LSSNDDELTGLRKGIGAVVGGGEFCCELERSVEPDLSVGSDATEADVALALENGQLPLLDDDDERRPGDVDSPL
jgi:hypothetical protein